MKNREHRESPGRLPGRTTRYVLLAALLATTALSRPAHPQDRPTDSPPAEPLPTPYIEETQVRLVLVPVTVTDADGEPVLDLREEDFELLVDGKPHPIESFDPPLIVEPEVPADVDTSAAPPAAEPKQPETVAAESAEALPAAVSRRWSYVALTLDRYMSSTRGVARGFSALREQLVAPMPPRTRVGLFVISDGRLLTEVPFTDEIDAIRHGVERIWKDHEQVDQWIRDDEEASPPIWGKFRGSEMSRSIACSETNWRSLRQAMRIRNVLSGLEILARAMGELPGRKSVLLLSEGVRMRAGMNYLGGDLSVTHCVENAVADFRRTTDTFKTANVTLSPINLLGLYFSGPGDPMARDEQLATATFLADETGGRLPSQTNDFDGEITRAIAQPLRAYLIGMRPGDTTPGSRHTIEVRVKRPGLQVRSRREYVVPEVDYTDKARFSVASVMPGSQDELVMASRFWVTPADGKNARLEMQVTVPTGAFTTLPATDGRSKLDIQVNGILRDTTGRADEIVASAYTVRFDPASAPPRLVLQEAIELPLRRDSELLIVVHDRLSGDTTSESFAIPALSRAQRRASVTAPRVFSPVDEDHVLTPSGTPLMALETDRGRYLPAAGRPGSGDMAVAARVLKPEPENTVRFCDGDGDRRCTPGVLAASGSADGELLAWAFLDQLAAGQDEVRVQLWSDQELRAEIWSATGVLAASAK